MRHAGTGTTQRGGRRVRRTLLAAVALLAVSAGPAGRVAPVQADTAPVGSWTLTGSMGVGRVYFSSILLKTGKVLAIGNASQCTQTGCTILNSAELYDPATGQWTPTGSLHYGRGYFTATLLPSGRVLVAGGLGYAGLKALSSAEIYDPSTGTWTLTGSMHVPRIIHTATLLPNGKVLVTGGVIAATQSSYTPTNTAEVYDPATGTWTLTGSMETVRFRHTATLLFNGKVLITGGDTCSCAAAGTPISSAELYDPSTGTFTATGSLHVPRQFHTATLLKSGPLVGQVLVVGGGCCGVFNVSATKTAELYNPATGTFTYTGAMATPRQFHSATLLLNGQVLVAGGDSFPGAVGNTAEVYDPATQRWSSAGVMNDARYVPTATLFTSGPLLGQVLVAGGGCMAINGVPGSSMNVQSAELYAP